MVHIIIYGPFSIFYLLFRLRRLCTLDFEWNEIVEIQPEIEKLKNLGLLELGNNSIVKLPDTMPNLRMLTRFNVANNCLSDFPVSVSWTKKSWMTKKLSFCCWKEQSSLILLVEEPMKGLAWKITSGHQISKASVLYPKHAWFTYNIGHLIWNGPFDMDHLTLSPYKRAPWNLLRQAWPSIWRVRRRNDQRHRWRWSKLWYSRQYWANKRSYWTTRISISEFKPSSADTCRQSICDIVKWKLIKV